MDLDKIKKFIQQCESAIKTGSHTPEEIAVEAKKTLPMLVLTGLKMQTSGKEVANRLKPLYKTWGFDISLLEANTAWLGEMLTALKTK